ncbi:MAG TPA: hypothetical protein VD927_00275 [Chryseosolibacter sp.]|nr:hypothetical protein [Chryseosolibacter sp.]
MAFDSKTRETLLKLFKGTSYRKIISERAKVHPNTVANVLNGNDNPAVELEILIYAQEIQPAKEQEERKRIEAQKILKRLSR